MADEEKVKLNEKEISKEELEREKEKADKEPDVKIEQTGPGQFKKRITG